MPVEFVATQQAERYGRFVGEPNPEQLAKYFHLDETDLRRISRRHADHNTLGSAVQLGTVRFLGTFLSQYTDVPLDAVAYLARQLNVADVQCLRRYRDDVRWRHLADIKRHYGYQDFSEPVHVYRLVRWLYTRATIGAESPSVLFDHATSWLIEHKIRRLSP